MYMKDLSRLVQSIDSLVVFRNVKDGTALKALRRLLSSKPSVKTRVARYSDFVAALFQDSYDWAVYLLTAAAEDENDYVRLRSKELEVPQVLADCVRGELAILQELAGLTSGELQKFTGFDGYLPRFDTTEFNFAEAYESRIAGISRTGYGIYARNVMFRVEESGIVPVVSPDKTDIRNLIGYERERQILIDNTQALLDGKPAANTLLYGDAGTGKSSSVKAVVNMLAGDGLRLIEVRKEQLRQIPTVMEQLRDNPLKFILFIDDLSFSKDDDNFGSLKAILEGSASVRAANTVIYATSNRRHLVKETFTDREGDDIHRNDTIEELNSLSERFGLTILFSKPDRAGYLDIVHEMAKARGIEMDEKVLDIQASAFATRKGGRTPRAAEQFIDSLLSR